MHLKRFVFAAALTILAPSALIAAAPEQAHRGYYRFPAVHGDSIVFTSEGDLWSVGIHGGAAQRLTTSPGMEHYASISPDGKTIAFQAAYEGPDEVYTMPIDGAPCFRLRCAEYVPAYTNGSRSDAARRSTSPKSE